MTTAPYGAMPQDTGEFMLGKVAVTPIFLESSGQVDTSTEDWSPSLIQTTLQTIQTGVDWWVDLLAAQQTVHTLEFAIDTTYAAAPVATRYEPINRVSNDFALWVQEFVSGAGFDTPGGLEADVRAFNHAQRQKMDADWAYTMFVVNSNNDLDGSFAPGGSFARAFAFAGGLFLVSPSTRPASTFAHETGHIFWAKDEYVGGASHSERRGYYNAQNDNAADNPQPGFVQQPSIMATGELLDEAYENHVSPPSTLAMIGWRDSDHDGIFDVLDVPLELVGTGYYDSVTGEYKFRGAAKVGVLPNLNSEGLRNDITLNRISSIQYRVDNGSWTTAAEPDVYEADLDLSIPLASSAQVIEIRAIDADTGITSNVFQGRLARADAVTVLGINGFLWIDANKNSLRDVGEFGDSGWHVNVLSGSTGQPVNLRRSVEPDELPNGALTAESVAGVKFTTVGGDSDGRAGVLSDSAASTGTKLFGGYSRLAQGWTPNWTGVSRRMLVEFENSTSLVEIDAIGTGPESYGRIEAYDASGNLLDRFTSPKLSDGQVVTLRVESALGTIASVRVGGHATTAVRLDNLRLGPQTQVTTQSKGEYSISGLPSGDYIVQVTPPTGGFSPATAFGAQQSVSYTAGSVLRDIDFAFRASSWQNPQNRLDVNDDQLVSALDVLLIVNEINEHGPHELPTANLDPPPFLDVNNDSLLSALDALLIVNFINDTNTDESEGEVAQAEATAVSGGLASGGIATYGLIGSTTATTQIFDATAAYRTAVYRTPGTVARDEALLAIQDELSDLALEWMPGRRRTRLLA